MKQLTHLSSVQTEEINGHKISYILKPNRKDIPHLIVLFNGYRHGGCDFENAINFFKCNVLIVLDIFKGNQSCYLGNEGKLDFSDLVVELINRVLQKLSLTKNDCTLLGGSKGGFASLFIGIKYNFPNIVSSAPVGHIGSWMKDYDKNIAKNVMGDNYSEEDVSFYNKLLINEIDKNSDKNKNIYLFISQKDNFYLDYGQRELLERLNTKYQHNCNVFFTHSDLAFQHNQITPYFVQEMLSITNLLSQGIVTKLGECVIDNIQYTGKILPSLESKNVFESRKNTLLLKEESVNDISLLNIVDGKLYIEGDLYIRNYHSATYNDLDKHIAFFHLVEGKKYEFLLGTVPKAERTRELYQNTFFNYTAAGTATMGFSGIDLSAIDNGVYKLCLSVQKEKSTKNYQGISFKKNIDKKFIFKESEYHLFKGKDEKDIFLLKRPVLGEKNPLSTFDVSNMWLENNKFHVEGMYMIKGLAMPDFHIGHYYLVAKNIRSGEIYSTLLGRVRKKEVSEAMQDVYYNYLSCHYATMYFKGVDISSWDLGEYEVFISLSHNNEIFSEKLNNTLLIDEKTSYLK